MNARAFDDLLFVLTLIESVACAATAYMVVVLVVSGHHHHRLATQLGIFGGLAAALLLTATIADVYHTRWPQSDPDGPRGLD